MGRDKFENEELLKYGWPNDVWFHVDDLSSAHVYLRLPDDCSWEEIPKKVIEQCCQLVKNNSIEGCKKREVFVIYTPFPNLHKDPNTMQVGAVSFHDGKLRKRVKVTKNKEIVKRIEKTREEREVDLAAEKAQRDANEMKNLKAQRRKQKQEEARLKEQRKKESYERSYDRLFEDGQDDQGMSKEYEDHEDFEDNFM